MNSPTSPSSIDNAEPVAGIGHNRPPAFDAEVLNEHKATVDEFMKVTITWLKLEKIEGDLQAEQLTDQISGLRALHKKVDEARKAAKKPHDEAGQEVQDAFLPILTKLEKAGKALKPKLAAYATAKAEAERAAKAKAEAEARKEREEAEERARQAEAAGDIAAQVDAEEAKKAAEEKAKVAAKAVDTKVKSASGGGRTMGLRTQKVAEITNINVVFMHFKEHPKVAELLTSLATAEVRSKGYDHDAAPLPGIKITEKQVIA